MFAVPYYKELLDIKNEVVFEADASYLNDIEIKEEEIFDPKLLLLKTFSYKLNVLITILLL